MLPPEMASKASIAPSVIEQDAFMVTQVSPKTVQREITQAIDQDLSVMDVLDD